MTVTSAVNWTATWTQSSATTPQMVLGEVLYLTFRGHRNGSDELIGTDTFVIRDGLIHMHTF
jgi:hypothetical protein